jgi:hypothetical protein
MDTVSSSAQIVAKVAQVEKQGFGVAKLVDGKQVNLETNMTQDKAMDIIANDSECTLTVWWKELWRMV